MILKGCTPYLHAVVQIALATHISKTMFKSLKEVRGALEQASKQSMHV